MVPLLCSSNGELARLGFNFSRIMARVVSLKDNNLMVGRVYSISDAENTAELLPCGKLPNKLQVTYSMDGKHFRGMEFTRYWDDNFRVSWAYKNEDAILGGAVLMWDIPSGLDFQLLDPNIINLIQNKKYIKFSGFITNTGLDGEKYQFETLLRYNTVTNFLKLEIYDCVYKSKVIFDLLASPKLNYVVPVLAKVHF